MKITGVLTSIKETVNVSKDFRKRAFVVLHNDRGHLEHISFELFQDQCELIDSFKIYDQIEVEFNLKGRKWIDKEGTERFINTLQAWRVDRVEKENL